jgi:hypothetical protein
LTPFLARSVGFLPVFFPPEGCLGHAPVHAQPVPVDALHAVVDHQAGLPHLVEEAGLHPLLEAVVGGGAGDEAGGVQGLPLAAGAEDEEDGLQAVAVTAARAAAAEAVGVLALRDQGLDQLPEVVVQPPVVRHGGFSHVRGSNRAILAGLSPFFVCLLGLSG